MTTSKKMTQKEQREIAAGAARSQLRKMGFELKNATADSAFATLDDMTRTEPNLIASKWYLNASENQFKLFESEWKSTIEKRYGWK